jgi:hypothetical protein
MTLPLLYAAGDMPLSTVIAQWVVLVIKVAALVALGIIGKKCFDRLIAAMELERPGLETSWGGLGGSLGGWSISKSLAWLIVNVLLLVVFVALATQVGDGLASSPETSAPTGLKKPGAGTEAPQPTTPARPELGKTEPSKSEPPKSDSKAETPAKQETPQKDASKQ